MMIGPSPGPSPDIGGGSLYFVELYATKIEEILFIGGLSIVFQGV